VSKAGAGYPPLRHSYYVREAASVPWCHLVANTKMEDPWFPCVRCSASPRRMWRGIRRQAPLELRLWHVSARRLPDRRPVWKSLD